ncbi:MAG: prepilin-type N-terminal cleavage/methylation domain-containing protein, partial [Candidatus Gracilibacteria bacterium]|nr:prepilin-type N-terminal cleavage/methylation domain-containing protein [Candidatus Gracilibacteria bacterium]
MKLQKQKAFTLVELIVVITILAILGTIAFISLQGYSQNSRDSVRISDVSRMKTTLELFHLDAGKYPSPTEGLDVT